MPSAVKRQLRQEAGFGCCKCGGPIYDYQHIVPFSDADPHFRPEDMMILCPLDHREATVGAMPVTEQRKYKKEPFNIKRGYADGLLKINQPYAAIVAGSNLFVGERWMIRVDGEPLLSLAVAEGRLQLDLALYDKEDALLALVEQNEWISGDPLPWDIEAGFQRLKIRRKLSDVALDIDARSLPLSVGGNLWRKKQNIKLSRSEVSVHGVVENASVRDLALVNLGLDIDTTTSHFGIVPGGTGFLISGGTLYEAMRNGVLKWLEIKHGKPFDGISRYAQCPCNSGKKFKWCHEAQIP